MIRSLKRQDPDSKLLLEEEEEKRNEVLLNVGDLAKAHQDSDTQGDIFNLNTLSVCMHL